MSEIKPWMRLAADASHRKSCYFSYCMQVEICRMDVESIAEAIAAHAPPVEGMVNDLRSHDKCDKGECTGVADALDIYDSWLARQGDTVRVK